MGLIKSGSKLRAAIEQMLSSASSIVVCSAYVTTPGVDWLLEHLNDDANLTVVGRFEPDDFINGASDTTSLLKLIEAGHEVYALDKLHAKIYLFDSDSLILGSANLTGKGLGLQDISNIEASTIVDLPSATDVDWVYSLPRSAIKLSKENLISMQNFLAEHMTDIRSDKYLEWPLQSLSSLETKLFVSDFPLNSPGIWHSSYGGNGNTDFSKIYRVKHNDVVAKAIFMNSKAYIWLKSIVERENRTITFGEMSSLLQDHLYDDPKPYRKTTKEILHYLYSFVNRYASEELVIFTPGARSKCIKIIHN